MASFAKGVPPDSFLAYVAGKMMPQPSTTKQVMSNEYLRVESFRLCSGDAKTEPTT